MGGQTVTVDGQTVTVTGKIVTGFVAEALWAGEPGRKRLSKWLIKCVTFWHRAWTPDYHFKPLD